MGLAFFVLGEANATSVRVCNQGGNYKTVKAAVEAANNNTIITEIIICSGTSSSPKIFSESSTINITRPNLTITGESGKSEDVIVSYNNTVFLLSRTNISIRNITIKSSDDHEIIIENKTNEKGEYFFPKYYNFL